MYVKNKNAKYLIKVNSINKKISDIETKEIFLKAENYKLIYLYFYTSDNERIRIDITKNRKKIYLIGKSELKSVKSKLKSELKSIINKVKKLK